MTGAAAAADLGHYQSDALARLGVPFSAAVTFGDLIFLSGQIGNRPGTPEPVPGGIVAEARQTMDNIAAVLEAVGSSWDKVVKCTVMLADTAEWPAFNEIYAGYFTPPYPARSAFAASGLALGARSRSSVSRSGRPPPGGAVRALSHCTGPPVSRKLPPIRRDPMTR